MSYRNSTPPKIIETINIEKTFYVKSENIKVLKGVTMQIAKGEFVIIFGPSGCGKSTLLHTIIGLEVPTKGSLNILGTDIYNKLDDDGRADFRKKHFGTVYQQPNWIKSMTVIENVAFASRLNGVDLQIANEKAAEALDRVGIMQWADYLPSELSSGQQQRVALARAIVINPEIIIADEPTGNLDYESGHQLMELMKKMNDTGATIIMVTHDLEYLKYCQRALRFFAGNIVEEIKQPNTFTGINHIRTKRGQTT